MRQMTNKEYRLNMLIDIAVRENWYNKFQWKVFEYQDIDGKLRMLDEKIEQEQQMFKKYLEESIGK